MEELQRRRSRLGPILERRAADVAPITELTPYTEDAPEVVTRPDLFGDGSLRAFVERTTTFRLDPWQIHLCAELEAAWRSPEGCRILIHAMPQVGKSVIVSQRFPAWILAQAPAHRVKLACYNVTHSARFGRVVRDLMQSRDWQSAAPEGAQLPKIAGSAEFTTAARRAAGDAQPSFAALGLESGFVGQGVDTLLIDDPYRSAADAYSPIIREGIWTFWTDSTEPRITEFTKVFVMFHRYHEDDLAGRLLRTGKFRLLRYAAEEDGDAEMPCSPPGRPVGSFLSPRFSAEFYARQKHSGFTWLGQFQGRPTAKEGMVFKPAHITKVRIDEVPRGLPSCRAWDLAATEGAGAYTAGVRIDGPDAAGLWYVVDMVYGQWAPEGVDNAIRACAAKDGLDTRIHFPQDPAQAGKRQAPQLVALVPGYDAIAEPVQASKEARARGLASQVNAGNVRMVEDESELGYPPWNTFLTDAMSAFPLGAISDPIDAAADAFNELASPFEFEGGEPDVSVMPALQSRTTDDGRRMTGQDEEGRPVLTADSFGGGYRSPWGAGGYRSPFGR